MKKTLWIILIIFLIIIFSLLGMLMTNNSKMLEVKKENIEYERFLEREILGTDIATLINKAINQNEKNNVSKDENGYYIDNGENSIRIDIKMITIDKTYPMESIYDNGVTNFVQNFNLITFKCIDVQYHEKTGRISKIVFEQLEE